MITTAQEIITDALGHLGVIGVGQTLTANDVALGLRRLNQLMESWATKGMLPSSIGQFVDKDTQYSLEEGVARAAGYALARDLAATYGAVLSASSEQQATEAIDTLRDAHLSILPLNIDPALTPRTAYNIYTDR